MTAFPFGTSQLISLGYATVRATRITYVGELGWELYVPAEFAVGVYEDLMAAGAEFEVARGGYYAIESLRLEKGYRAFGRELTPNDNPVEAGLLFACKLGTDIRVPRPRSRRAGQGRRSAAQSHWFRGRFGRSDAVGRRTDPARRCACGQVTLGGMGRDHRGLRRLGATSVRPMRAITARLGARRPLRGQRRRSSCYPITVSLKPIYDPANERTKS